MTEDRAGAVLLAFAGFVAAVGASGHSFGTLTRIGPGFFPMLAAIALLVSGLALAFRLAPNTSGRKVGSSVFLRASIPVLGALLVFAALLPIAGLGPAAFVLVVTGARPDRAHLGATLSFALIVAVLASLVFVLALGVRVPVLAW